MFVCSLDDSNLSGATAIKADGEGIEVLFDMMAHTLDGYVIFLLASTIT
jgi:hypothetical protein